MQHSRRTGVLPADEPRAVSLRARSLPEFVAGIEEEAEGLLAELAEFIALVRAGAPAASLAASELFVEAAQLQYDDGFVELLNSDPYWQKPTTNAAANLIAAYFRAVAIWAAGKGRT